MSDKPTPTGTADSASVAVAPIDLKASATVFVPLSKQTVEPVAAAERLHTGELVASTSGQIVPTFDDAQSTPTPASVSSFADLVKAAREASADSAEVSMMSMTDDDSELSSADVSINVDPQTPLLPLSISELGDLEASPTGGLGGGVLCGLPKPAEASPEPASGNRVLEGLIPQKPDYDPRPKYRRMSHRISNMQMLTLGLAYPPQRSCNIHIQNLPSHYGDAELSALCEEFGPVVSVRVFRRPVAAPPNRRLPEGQNSTYGFVLFDNIISAENCVNALRQRYKNIYPSFARQAAPAVHQPAFVGLLEAMAFADLHQADPNLNVYTHDHGLNTGLGQPLYSNQGPTAPVYSVAPYDTPIAYEVLPSKPAPAYEPIPETVQPSLVSASVENPGPHRRPRALTIKPMPPPIQSFVKPGTTAEMVNAVLNESSILIIIDGLPKDFGVGLLDTLFAPHAIHDVRLHRKGRTDGVRGSVRVSTRVAALQSVEKLSGMQFGSSAGGLRVRIAEEVSGEGRDEDMDTVPALPSYRTLPDLQGAQTLFTPSNTNDGPLSASISAPAVASMIGSGLNQLLFASDSNESLAPGSQRIPAQRQLSPANGRFLTSPAHLAIPFTPAMVSSISMPHVPPRFLNPSPSYNLLPSLRVGNVNLPITNLFPSSNSLYACGNSTSANLAEKLQPAPEPPVIKVSSYASAVKKSAIRAGASEDQKTKKRKPRRASRSSKVVSEKSSPEIQSKPTIGEKGTEHKVEELKDKPAVPTKALAEDKQAGASSPEQPKIASIERMIYGGSPPAAEIRAALVTQKMPVAALNALDRIEIIVKTRSHWNDFYFRVHQPPRSKLSQDSANTTPMRRCFEPLLVPQSWDSDLLPDDNEISERRTVVDQSHGIWAIFQPGDQFEVAWESTEWQSPESNYEMVIRVWDFREPFGGVLEFA
ncbi:RNA recognition motif protein [Ceratobasidium sp. AG-Ba]|nr:RNA recognition motif protein [Ceratobasidium sp. AG-Ba]QRW11016.1 RNA recognition motif protein [Ceratobasidium sp. AG-Ba]